MQETPKGNRPHIAVFGRRNTGKSSLINALTNQDLALVSDVPGTTTDPVYKAMELLPLGPVVMIDTAGIDDQGSLGELRVKKTLQVIDKTDLAILVIDPEAGIENYERGLVKKLINNDIPVVGAINKIDNCEENEIFLKEKIADQLKNQDVRENLVLIPVSAACKNNIELLREKIAENIPEDFEKDYIIGDLIKPEDVAVLVTPIDSGAPKGRLILPQVQTIRDVLDGEAINMVTKENHLEKTLDSLKEDPAIVVTDSQAFNEVAKKVPERILMTSFSVLFARYKGDLELYLKGCQKLESLVPGDKILIAEACTHRRQDEDIGTVKIPNWLQEKIGGELIFDNVAGREYPDNLKQYDLILHCGGCMLNRKEILSRLYKASDKGIPVVNYGMAIAWLNGILDRALEPFSGIDSDFPSY